MTREEAIRKLQKQKAEYIEEWVDFSGVAEAYDMAIEALSAEAAQPEIIYCRECKHFNDYFVECDHESGLKHIKDDYDHCSYAERREE